MKYKKSALNIVRYFDHITVYFSTSYYLFIFVQPKYRYFKNVSTHQPWVASHFIVFLTYFM